MGDRNPAYLAASHDGGTHDGGKADGAMLAIGELADRIGVPAHVLRYWETRFPQLKPLQRAGRRRYYRPADIALVERIHHLLHVRGFTLDGARKALSEPAGDAPRSTDAAPAAALAGVPVDKLLVLRQRLAAALS